MVQIMTDTGFAPAPIKVEGKRCCPVCRNTEILERPTTLKCSSCGEEMPRYTTHKLKADITFDAQGNYALKP